MLVTTQDTHSIPLTHSRSQHLSFRDGMIPRDAAELLSRVSNTSNDNQDKQEVARQLDHQPLALACAAVYVRYTELPGSKIC